MLWKIAWRNLWRNKRRSAIILTSIVIGVIALIITDTIYMGMGNQMLYNQIGIHVGHIQIHKKGYHDNPLLEMAMNDPQIVNIFASRKDIVAYAPRILSFGLLSSSYSSSGVSIVGIDPAREKAITLIARSVTSGRYLSGNATREILISEKLAEKLEVEVGDKVVAMASRLDGSVGSEVFRVVGTYRTFNSDFDKVTIFIPIEMAARMLGMGQRISEYVLKVKRIEQTRTIRDELRLTLGSEYEVLDYKDILPMLVYQVEMFDEFMYIYYLIIGIALVFGIVNTMLMAVFERIREIGVLKAIGMPDRKIFWMVILESATLGLLGSAIGTVLGYLIYLPLSHTGIDLSMFSKSLESFGVGSVIYPVFIPRVLASVFFSIPIFAILGAIYPAIKAIRFQPVEAMRYV
jgi:ABC-type lipoprotein release transport system permease subunit